MGGKSRKSVTVGYWYKIAYHMGLGVGPIDAFLEFRGGDKTAWKGELTSTGTIHVDAQNLWGGEKDQGGIVGDVDVLFGDADQQPSSYMLNTFGPQIPAWRGLASVLFKGGKYGALNPYPQKSSYKIRRILKGWNNDNCWYASKADIQRSYIDEYSIRWIKTRGCPYQFNSPSDVSTWDSNPSNHDTVETGPDISWPTGVGATGLAWLLIDAPNGIRESFELDIKINYDDSGKVIGLKNLTIGGSTPPDYVNGYPSSAGFKIILPRSLNAFSGWACFACVDSKDISTGGSLGGPSKHRMLCSNIQNVITLHSMNPAHVIYYSLTNSDMGRVPVARINDASFKAAADWYFDQGFGLCTEYDPSKESVADFQARICKVAGCSISRSPVDGQWYIDVANGEYDLAALDILTDDDVLDFAEQPTVLDSAVNSLSVTYFDPQIKDTVVAPPVQAMGLIDAFGTISQSTEYPEIPTGDLALRVAERDLRAIVTPLRSFTLTTTRACWAWRPGQYKRLQLPKRGIADMVVIVGDVQRGTLRSGAMRIVLTQDVYSLPSTTFVSMDPAIDTGAPQPPAPIVAQAAFEAPYIDVVAALSRADLAALPAEAGYLHTVAADPAISRGYELFTSPDGSTWTDVAAGDWCPMATTAAAYGYLDTVIELATFGRADEIDVGMAALWDNEIVRVDAIDATAGTITIARGCADTVPATHAAGSRIWCWQGNTPADTTEYTAGETLHVKLLTDAPTARLDLQTATDMLVSFAGRASRPYPPGALKVNGIRYPSAIKGALALSWAHRDRLLQADQLVDTLQDNVGPEAGTTYTLRLYGEAGTLLRTETGLTGTSYTWSTEEADSGLTIPGSPGFTFNEDTFDTDSTSQYTQYAQSPASWTIANGQLTASGGSNSKFIRKGTSYTDVLIETDMAQAGDGGLVLRFLNANNFYQLTVQDDSGNSSIGAAIYKCLNGIFTNISGDANFPWPRGTPKRFGFRASGTTLTAYIDGVQILQVTDASIAGPGGVGMRMWNSYAGNSIHLAFRWDIQGSPAPRLNGRIRAELESVRSALVSHQKHNITVDRAGYGYQYGNYYGGI